eukprot:TRINITY_DN3973_c0_g1_i1.p1 TRINITY_DN3973_c0_g1~~TRINITY_DN3973_c0_g1_i1.p1  ORF type:complete len:337 (-),score=55.17 TRINITY_DN3973_c0_g1_i1:346-1356(-)
MKTVTSRYRITQTAGTGFDRSRKYRVDGYNDVFPSVTTILDIINKPGLHIWKHRTSMNSVRTLLEATSAKELGRKDDDAYTQWIDETVKRASSEPQRISTSAATFGTNTHSLIEKWIADPSTEVPETHRVVMASFQAWREASGLQLLAETNDYVIEQKKIVESDPEPLDTAPLPQAETKPKTKAQQRKGFTRPPMVPIVPKGINGTEVIVCSPTYGYAGCLDAVAVRTKPGGNKSLVVLDWKTSNMLTMENALQVAAYAKAFEETFGEPVEEAWVVRLAKSQPSSGDSYNTTSTSANAPMFEARQVLDIDGTFKVFLNTLDMWRNLQRPPATYFSL